MTPATPRTRHESSPPDRDAGGALWLNSALRFAETEMCGGLVLLFCASAALLAANSLFAQGFAEFWRTEAGFAVGPFALKETLGHWVNDGLMTIFFFVVGLEIKREFVSGELRDVRKAVLPAAAALGGMIVPAAMYFALQRGEPGEPGWGIPMATDIAFVVGVLALLGRRVPPALRILLLSLAIIDDLGAVVVVAMFYAGGLSPLPLALAAAGFITTWFCRRIGVRWAPLYVLLGIAAWLAVLHSGVHPTLTGVVLGLMTPARAALGEGHFAAAMDRFSRRLREGIGAQAAAHRVREMRRVTTTAHQSVSVLDRLETALHPWVAYAIMPLFALANAGVSMELGNLRHPVAMSVAAGLVLGKPIGIILFSWLVVRSGLGRLPAGVTWGVVCGAGCLGGIGFTMSLFMGGLGLEGELLVAGKVGVLAGSVVSALAGCAILLLVTKSPATNTAEEQGADPAAESPATSEIAGIAAVSPTDDPAAGEVYHYLSCWQQTREWRWRPFGRG